MVIKIILGQECKLVKMVRGELVLDYQGAGYKPAFILKTSYTDETPVLNTARVFVTESGRVKTG